MPVADELEGQTGHGGVLVQVATLDPFHGYANAIRDELPDAASVLDAFHVVKLGVDVVDTVRGRVQQDTTPSATSSVESEPSQCRKRFNTRFSTQVAPSGSSEFRWE